jgi:hypothetical protein
MQRRMTDYGNLNALAGRDGALELGVPMAYLEYERA